VPFGCFTIFEPNEAKVIEFIVIFHHVKLMKNYEILLFNQSIPFYRIVFSIFPMASQVLTLDVNDI
jgi:hypothetical protein